MAEILLVDDDIGVLRTMTMMLQGHTVHTATSGREALARIESVTPQIVICDILMPEKDGLEVMRELREKLPHIKIIAISGGGRLSPDGYLEVARRLGADTTLEKPFTRQGLLLAIEELLLV